MGRIYTAQFNEIAVTALQDLFEIVAPADAVVIIHDFLIAQRTDFGDAQAEIMGVILRSGQTTSGSGGASITPAPINLGDAAFGGTVERNNTIKASAGTIVTHYSGAWNIRMPLREIFTPETRPVLSPSRRATLELIGTAPADSLTMSGTITFEEIGG